MSSTSTNARSTNTSRNSTRPDVLVRNCGSVWAFNPLTEEAKTFFDVHVASEPWQWIGTSLCVDARFALGLIEALIDAGFKLG